MRCARAAFAFSPASPGIFSAYGEVLAAMIKVKTRHVASEGQLKEAQHWQRCSLTPRRRRVPASSREHPQASPECKSSGFINSQEVYESLWSASVFLGRDFFFFLLPSTGLRQNFCCRWLNITTNSSQSVGVVPLFCSNPPRNVCTARLKMSLVSKSCHALTEICRGV